MAVDEFRAPKQKTQKDNHPLKPRSTSYKNKGKKLNGKNPNFVPLGKNKFAGEKKSDDEEAVRTKNHNFVSLGKNKFSCDKEKDEKEAGRTKKAIDDSEVETILLSFLPAAQQLDFLLDRFQSAFKFQLSPLELDVYKDTCMVELSKNIRQDEDNLYKHIKDIFGESWKEVLCEDKVSEGTIERGSPAVLFISVSAIKSLELLRGLKGLTKDCRPAKLFAKHMKVEEQVEMLAGRVNIASGTPSRIKKLIDMDALLLSRLSVIVLDLRSDVKGYSLLTLPQLSAEFWGLFKAHFNERIIEGNTRICFYGPSLIRPPKKARNDA